MVKTNANLINCEIGIITEGGISRIIRSSASNPDQKLDKFPFGLPEVECRGTLVGYDDYTFSEPVFVVRAANGRVTFTDTVKIKDS